MTTAPAPGSNPPLTSGPPTATTPVPPEAIDAALDTIVADLTAELHERGIVPAIDREFFEEAITRAVGAAAPAIRDHERQRLLSEFADPEARLGLLKLARAEGMLNERARIRQLAEHHDARVGMGPSSNRPARRSTRRDETAIYLAGEFTRPEQLLGGDDGA